jgi:hypothetical protein
MESVAQQAKTQQKVLCLTLISPGDLQRHYKLTRQNPQIEFLKNEANRRSEDGFFRVQISGNPVLLNDSCQVFFDSFALIAPRSRM